MSFTFSPVVVLLSILAHMRFAVSALTLCLTIAAAAQAPDPTALVNPLIGTQRGPIGYGGTMPFVTPPFGMTNWTAQTRQNKISVTSYNYDDPTISGFIGTHQPAIWMGDYGYVTLMPQLVTSDLKSAPTARALPYRHADETAHPDSYNVTLQSPSGPIQTELTATTRCAYFRFHFPAGSPARILVETSRPNIAGTATLDASLHEITGSNPDRMDAHLGPLALPNFRGYFVIQFRQPWREAHVYGLDDAAASRGAYADFKADTPVEARVGTSFLSIEQARDNLRHEIPIWNFETTREQLHAAWNEKLARLQVQGASTQEQTRLYTALYHALLYPRTFSEYGRYYSAFDDRVHPGESYTAYSIWDTFRAENSLLTLLAPERIPGMITALLQNFQEGGWMPKWPNPSYTNIMIGTHADSFVAEAVRKNFTGFDRTVAWQAVYKDAMTPPEATRLAAGWTANHTPHTKRAPASPFTSSWATSPQTKPMKQPRARLKTATTTGVSPR